MNRVPELCPAETGSHLSTIGEYLVVILVPAAYVITGTGTVHFSSWLHKWLLKTK